jgi:hypothetical protein
MEGIINSQMSDPREGVDNAAMEGVVKSLITLKSILYKEGMIEQIADGCAAGHDDAAVVSEFVYQFVSGMKSNIETLDAQALFIMAVYSIAEIVRSLKQSGVLDDEDHKKITEDAISGVVMRYVEENPESIDAAKYKDQPVSEEAIKSGKRLMTGGAE